MPDLTIHTASVCRSATWFKTPVPGSNGQNHTVEFGPSNGKYKYDWSCTCKGFTSRRTCKHVDAAKELRCGWNAEGDPGHQPDGPPDALRCPQCGDHVVAIQVAV